MTRVRWLGLVLVVGCAHFPKARPGEPCETDADCTRGHGCLHHAGGEQEPYSECYPLTDGELVAFHPVDRGRLPTRFAN
jgi:hypothetical protein